MRAANGSYPSAGMLQQIQIVTALFEGRGFASIDVEDPMLAFWETVRYRLSHGQEFEPATRDRGSDRASDPLIIRGQRVMLDADLARLYGVTRPRAN